MTSLELHLAAYNLAREVYGVCSIRLEDFERLLRRAYNENGSRSEVAPTVWQKALLRRVRCDAGHKRKGRAF
jgi:hypothetical protein